MDRIALKSGSSDAHWSSTVRCNDWARFQLSYTIAHQPNMHSKTGILRQQLNIAHRTSSLPNHGSYSTQVGFLRRALVVYCSLQRLSAVSALIPDCSPTQYALQNRDFATIAEYSASHV